jgi:uncharacterized protein YjbI with pentapeptide repeats
MAERRKRYTADDLRQIDEGDEIRRAIFDGLSFHGLSLKECLFENCSFEGANLRNVRLSSAEFRECNLSNVLIAGAAVFGATFERCKLLGVDWHEVERTEALTLKACNLDLCDFRGLDLSGGVFDTSSLLEADLSLTNLKKASFVEADLTRASIREAVFEQTDLRGANLTGWSLRRDELKGTIMDRRQIELLVQELGIQIL